MENSSRLYNTIVKIPCQHKNWLDIRHLYTLAWMMVGLKQHNSNSKLTDSLRNRLNLLQAIYLPHNRYTTPYKPMINKILISKRQKVIMLMLQFK